MRRGALVALVVAALFPARAYADDDRAAAEHFREGRRAFEAHDYTRAAVEFEAANKAKPAGAALLSAGLAWEFASDWLHAASDLAAAIDVGGLEARDEATARKHFADVEAKLGYVEVMGPSGARLSIDGHDEGAVPLRVRVLPGEHTILVRMPDGSITNRVETVAAGGVARVDATPAIAQPKAIEPKPSPVQATIGWIGIGTGAAAFVAGAIVGGVGLSTRDEFVSGGDTSVSLHDQAIALRTTANVLWVSAGVLAITGAVLVLTAPHTKVAVGVQPAGASLRVTF